MSNDMNSVAKFIFALNFITFINALPYQNRETLCPIMERNFDVQVYSVGQINVLGNIVVKCESRSKGVMDFSAEVEPEKDSLLTVFIVALNEGERKVMAKKDVHVTDRFVTVLMDINNIKLIDQVSKLVIIKDFFLKNMN